MKVDKFTFSVDFIVLNFEANKEVSIILGRPFLVTGKTFINVQKGELTIRVNDQQVTFNVSEAMKNPNKVEYCNFFSAANFVVDKRLNSHCNKEEIKAATFEELENEH